MIFNSYETTFNILTACALIPLVLILFLKNVSEKRYLALLSMIVVFLVGVTRFRVIQPDLIRAGQFQKVFENEVLLAVTFSIVLVVAFITLVILGKRGRLNSNIAMLEYTILNVILAYTCALAYINIEPSYILGYSCIMVAYPTPESVVSDMRMTKLFYIVWGTMFAVHFLIHLHEYYTLKKAQITRRHAAQSKLRVLSSIEIVDLDEFSDFLPSAHDKSEEV